MPTIIDHESFIAGVQVGRRIRLWDAARIFQVPIEERPIITQAGDEILTEAGDEIYPE